MCYFKKSNLYKTIIKPFIDLSLQKNTNFFFGFDFFRNCGIFLNDFRKLNTDFDKPPKIYKNVEFD